MTTLARAVADVVGQLAETHVLALAGVYGAADTWSVGRAAAASAAVPPAHRARVAPINAAWSAAPATPGAAIALALEAALAAHRAEARPRVDVVITGPDSPAAPVRLTSEVVRQLIDGAVTRVTLVSYAAYQLPTVVDALDAARARGVRVDIILESPENLDGGGGAGVYAKYGVYEWPLDQRSPANAKLHAKAVIVDTRDVLLTSANMTNAAYDKNIELGLLCRGGDTARRVQQHFDSLIARGILRRRHQSG